MVIKKIENHSVRINKIEIKNLKSHEFGCVIFTIFKYINSDGKIKKTSKPYFQDVFANFAKKNVITSFPFNNTIVEDIVVVQIDIDEKKKDCMEIDFTKLLVEVDYI